MLVPYPYEYHLNSNSLIVINKISGKQFKTEIEMNPYTLNTIIELNSCLILCLDTLTSTHMYYLN